WSTCAFSPDLPTTRRPQRWVSPLPRLTVTGPTPAAGCAWRWAAATVVARRLLPRGQRRNAKNFPGFRRPHFALNAQATSLRHLRDGVRHAARTTHFRHRPPDG